LQNTLLLDDDPVFAGYFCELLATAGVEDVRHRSAAEDVINDRTDLSAYERIFCDPNMPGMDGVEFIRELSKRQWPGQLFIVSLEAESVVRSSARLAQMSGIDLKGSLRKPVKLQQLIEVLNGMPLPNRRLAQSDTGSDRGRLIQEALVAQSIKPVYQPQLNLSTLQVDGFEALMRLRLSDGSLASPAEFFHLMTAEMEETLSRHLIELSISDFVQLGQHVRGSINLSPSMLRQQDLIEFLSARCERVGLDPSGVVIEVTENEPILDDPDLISSMSRLRIAGFGLALDDFGTGHANIHELGWFPFSEIKTDLSFGQNIVKDPFARAAVEFAIRAAGQLELQLTIEGVETAEAVALSRRLGGLRGQGYAIALRYRYLNACVFRRNRRPSALAPIICRQPERECRIDRSGGRTGHAVYGPHAFSGALCFESEKRPPGICRSNSPRTGS